MKIIGLTGPTGSGKSTVAKLALENGFAVIDCDKVAREVVESDSDCLLELCGAFGNDIMSPDGKLDRKKLASKAFATPEGTARLNEITLPKIAFKITEKIKTLKTNGETAVLLDAPTLFESGMDAVCDSVIAVLCPENIRRDRIIARDLLSSAQANVRLSASKPDEFYKSKTQHIVYNDGDYKTFLNKALKTILEVAEI